MTSQQLELENYYTTMDADIRFFRTQNNRLDYTQMY